MRGLLPLAAFLASLSAPALADTIHCESPGKTLSIDVDVAFNEERDGGEVTRVRVANSDFVTSTDPAETEYDPDTLAFAEVNYDRIQLGLETPNYGPMTFVLDIVRTYAPEPGYEPDKDVVVAGVARQVTVTATVVCSGW